MANQNLSQFGEKLFVADADHTFIWDTEASISKRVSRNSWLNSGTLTSDAPVTISQTWNNAAVAFTGLKFNAVSTASASGSLLLDLQVGGVTQASVSKSGNLTVTGNLAANGGNSFLSGTTLRIGNSNGDINLSGGSLVIPAATAFGWANTLLVRDGADGTLALRNVGAPQTFRVYNTYTDASNYERLDIGWTSNTLFIRNVKTGSGQNRDLVVTSGADMYLGSGNTDRWRIINAGHFIGNVDNAYDIGASGAARPRNLYVGSNIYASGNVGIGTTAPGAKLQVGTHSGAVPSGSVVAIAGAVPRLSFSSNDDSLNYGGYILSNYAAGTFMTLGTRDSNADTAALTLKGGNVGIGTTSPTSKLHVAGNASPSITVDNTLATGASQLLFKNTVVTGDTDGIFLNGSAQSGFGGNGSLNIKATTGPIAFHTNTVTNALSIAQNGAITYTNSVLAASGSSGTFGTVGIDNTYINQNSLRIFGFTSGLFLLGSAFTNVNPALKRSTTTIQARLADDSAFTNIQGKLTTETAFTATTVTPTGFITLYDSTGAAYKVPCVPA